MATRIYLLPLIAIGLGWVAGSTRAGRVDFQLFVEPLSVWDGNYSAQAAMLSVLGQFEQTLRTSGPWDATLELFVTDNETSAYATGAPGNYQAEVYNGRQYRAANPWLQIVRATPDPNGPIQPGGAGRDLYVNWNPNLSQPQSNLGLLRHELMHGLGMITVLEGPTMTPGGVVSKPGVGEETVGYIMDASLRDLFGRPLLGGYRGGYDRHVLSNYAVDNDWGDQNESGLYFRGFGDDGSEFNLPMNTRAPTATTNGSVDLVHITKVSYVSGRDGDWNYINAADRAFLRGLGYAAVTPGRRLPDYTQDSAVDGADFLLWQRTMGPAGETAADGNGDGAADGGDLVVWSDDFGDRDDYSHLFTEAAAMTAPGAVGGAITSPGDVDWIRFAAVAGDTYRTRSFAGSPAGVSVQLFQPDGVTAIPLTTPWRASDTGEYLLRVAGKTAEAMGSYGVSIELVPPDDHGDSAAVATAVAIPSRTAGALEALDQDWFSFAAEADQSFTVETNLGTLSDSVLELYAPDGVTRLAVNDDEPSGEDLSSLIAWTAMAEGTYFAKVTGYASQAGSYTLIVSSGRRMNAVPEPRGWALLLGTAPGGAAVLKWRRRGACRGNVARGYARRSMLTVWLAGGCTSGHRAALTMMLCVCSLRTGGTPAAPSPGREPIDEYREGLNGRVVSGRWRNNWRRLALAASSRRRGS
ncbi:MAG: PPC domain-containing protein [Pirellulales bacterium]|nr:PPC domain-containing protein [Pirellulales bacterium]